MTPLTLADALREITYVEPEIYAPPFSDPQQAKAPVAIMPASQWEALVDDARAALDAADLAHRHGADPDGTLREIERASYSDSDPRPPRVDPSVRQMIRRIAESYAPRPDAAPNPRFLGLWAGGTLRRWHGRRLPEGWWIMTLAVAGFALWVLAISTLIPGAQCVGCGL